ncbi:DNA adenine methylase [Agromyces atrinae]|uniref:DNA adenine methylase n=1 Tax=Agromyces atrinae TaxID=592376 RepID=UPI0035579C3D
MGEHCGPGLFGGRAFLRSDRRGHREFAERNCERYFELNGGDVSLFPEHGHYVEPFFGAGSVILAKSPVSMETVNDINGDLVNIFRVLRVQPAELEGVCNLTPHSREEFLAAREPAVDPLERARRTFVTLSQGRTASLCKTGWAHFQDPGLSGRAGVRSACLQRPAASPRSPIASSTYRSRIATHSRSSPSSDATPTCSSTSTRLTSHLRRLRSRGRHRTPAPAAPRRTPGVHGHRRPVRIPLRPLRQHSRGGTPMRCS